MPAKDRSFHFISGLPRSGSTLTAAILRQNPRFSANMSSPIAGLFDGMIAQVSAGTELSAMVSQDQRARLLRGLFESYYAEQSEPVIFDTNRAWTTKLPALMQVFPEAKVICLVRDVSWIMDSMERQFRQNPFEHTLLFNSQGERSTVYTRLEALAGAARLVGFPWHALREACYSEFANRIIIVEYDLITHRPKDVFQLLYEFLGEEHFEHDFSAVDYDAPSFDAQLGLEGLHKVHSEVAPRPRKTILPPDLFKRFENMAFWRDLPDSAAFKITAASDDKPQDTPL
ncbi:sulfotransferase [Phaeobacter gallaeciensis]|uniref:Sulfotransferase n=2 Tax=Roseobacteraceae TaxID=2854170 RepID=A0A366XBI9_9RHOB|nr:MULTISPECIES: sulfotransferase [Roseobacteraceae]MBT3140571.1 sulfotransferase [Falsiruegeria litorea]MBT8170310.1 sulfotransferase [Falsiruegeria litorea]RBW61964.1 sulfotransferase [Phaeobacter gallaeciensis]